MLALGTFYYLIPPYMFSRANIIFPLILSTFSLIIFTTHYKIVTSKVVTKFAWTDFLFYGIFWKVSYMIDLEGMFYKKYFTTSFLVEEVGILYLLTFAGYAYSYLRLY